MSLQEAIPGATMKKTACGNTIRDTKTAKKNRLLKTAGRVIVLITAVVLILIVGFGLYTSQYYRADADAIEVLQRGSDRIPAQRWRKLPMRLYFTGLQRAKWMCAL